MKSATFRKKRRSLFEQIECCIGGYLTLSAVKAELLLLCIFIGSLQLKLQLWVLRRCYPHTYHPMSPSANLSTNEWLCISLVKAYVVCKCLSLLLEETKLKANLVVRQTNIRLSRLRCQEYACMKSKSYYISHIVHINLKYFIALATFQSKTYFYPKI